MSNAEKQYDDKYKYYQPLHFAIATILAPQFDEPNVNEELTAAPEPA